MGNHPNYLGEFEEIVLLAILRLGQNAYGVSVRQTIEQQAKRPTSIGAVYATAERLERKGYISSREGEKTAERGGRAKRYFEITGLGLRVLREAEQARRDLMPNLVFGLSPIGGVSS